MWKWGARVAKATTRNSMMASSNSPCLSWARPPVSCTQPPSMETHPPRTLRPLSTTLCSLRVSSNTWHKPLRGNLMVAIFQIFKQRETVSNNYLAAESPSQASSTVPQVIWITLRWTRRRICSSQWSLARSKQIRVTDIFPRMAPPGLRREY